MLPLFPRRKPLAACSYCHEQSFKRFRRYGQAILLQRFHISFYCLLDVRNGFLPRLSLGHTAGQTWTFNHPKTILAWVDDNLSHTLTLKPGLLRVKSIQGQPAVGNRSVPSNGGTSASSLPVEPPPSFWTFSPAGRTRDS